MKRKMIPITLMLLAGAITSVITYVMDYSLTKMLWTLLAVLIIFFTLGTIYKNILDSFDRQIEKKKEAEREAKKAEGAVIEKEKSEEENQKPEEA